MNAITLVFALCQPETLPPPLLPTAPLIADLGGAYAKRVAATKNLRAMGEDARAALQKGAQADDLETRRRCQSLLAAIDPRRRAVAMIDQAFPVLPCYDCYSRELYWSLFRYSQVAGCYSDYPPDHLGKPWGKYRQATRLWLYDMAEAGVPLWMIREIVQMGWAGEAAYFKMGQ